MNEYIYQWVQRPMKVAIVDYPMEKDGVDADEILNDLRKMLRL